jgi:hypothetical protein
MSIILFVYSLVHYMRELGGGEDVWVDHNVWRGLYIPAAAFQSPELS